MQGSQKLKVKATASLVMAIALSISVIAPAYASDRVSQTAKVTVAMVPDCENITPSARSYAIAHHIDVCGLGGAATGGVTPLNTVSGVCGTSTILLNKTGSGRTLSVNYGFYSSLGNAVLRSLVVNVGSTGGAVGGWADVSPMGHYVYSAARLQTFPAGTALASLDGTIMLQWGLVCYMKGPTASMRVT